MADRTDWRFRTAHQTAPCPERVSSDELANRGDHMPLLLISEVVIQRYAEGLLIVGGRFRVILGLQAEATVMRLRRHGDVVHLRAYPTIPEFAHQVPARRASPRKIDAQDVEMMSTARAALGLRRAGVTQAGKR